MAGSEEDSAVNEECYDTLKNKSADAIDVLASNEAAITPFSNALFSKGVIPKPVHVAVLNTNLSPYERATKLINSVLAILESSPNPREVLKFFNDSMESVDSCIKQNILSGKDMHDMIIQLLSYALDTVLRVVGFSCTKIAAKSPPKKFLLNYIFIINKCASMRIVSNSPVACYKSLIYEIKLLQPIILFRSS